MKGRTIVLVPTIAALMLIAAFVYLGVWQLDRAQEKRVLQAEYDRRAGEARMQIGPDVKPAEALQYFRVQAQGVFDPEYQVLLDNRMHHGVPGYHILTPLRIAGSDTRVLVNRGWVPVGADRARLPAIDPPPGEVMVTGVATVPREGFTLGDPPALTRERPTVWPQFDLGRYLRSVPFALQPVVILLDPQSAAGGYVRAWARLDTGIAVHHGYAFQWFALAATVLVVYGVLIVRTRLRRPARSN